MPTLGFGALAVASVIGAVAAEFVSADAPPLVLVLATVGGLAVGLIAEHTLGVFLDLRARRQAAAQAVENLRARAPEGFAALLSPRHDHQIVPFLGRQGILETLLAWCTEHAATPFRLITGPGGVGKTRLADELQRRLRTLGTGWERLFLAPDQENQAAAVAALREHARDRPVLVVVDYAENRPGLREFLTEAYDDFGGGGTIRVLMLARTAGNWWDALTAVPGDLGAALTRGYGNADLPPLDADPQEIVDAAALAFARDLGVAVPEVPLAGTSVQLRVLDLTAAALVAVLSAKGRSGRADAVENVTTADVFEELLRHEATTYWEATADEIGISDRLTMAMRRSLVAAVALLGAKDEAAAVALAQRVLSVFTEDIHPDPGATATWLRKTYMPAAGSGQWIGPLTPDRVAEHLIVRVLTTERYAARHVDALLANLTTAQTIRAMTVLSRAATDPARGEEQQEAVRALADHLAEHLPPTPQAHAAALAAIPHPSVRMAPTAALLARRHAELLEDDGEHLAGSLATLGARLSAVGHAGDGLPPTQRAVRIYERLAASDPDRFEPDLARTLTELGERSAGVGHPGDALRTTQRAVQIYERLATTNPERFVPDLARTLAHLGRRHSHLGRPGDALDPTRRAVDIYGRLAVSDPDRFRPDLADSLADLGVWYGQLERAHDGMAATVRALSIREQLAQADPDRHLPGLATTLSHLGTWELQLGRREDLAPTERAVQIFERLAQSNPDRFEPDLAAALSRLGAWYSRVERLGDAPPATQRAVQILERLAQSNPDRFEPDLARSLSDLGVQYSAVGNPDEGMALAERAVRIFERLAQSNPDRVEPDLGDALSRLGDTLAQVNRLGDALSVRERAATVWQSCHNRGLPQVRDRLITLLDRLATAHAAVNGNGTAQGYRSRAAALRQDIR
ncbi:tetratricopeptide repeat protein [Promicromonospora iranensis]|uniref:Tetratricopeptide (TPR) repeat protein n=1 Tax=Promicromonospora iranensis TaxID=1105144 RepID=A0ABU2CTL6_9MICO|nr:tetratricopeptide repeat protein [Promicromonospora iranensis]MDR7384699.1 tetratricopeptide (TPR) repeat protein [Promicromonospora iranensis]